MLCSSLFDHHFKLIRTPRNASRILLRVWKFPRHSFKPDPLDQGYKEDEQFSPGQWFSHAHPPAMAKRDKVLWSEESAGSIKKPR